MSSIFKCCGGPCATCQQDATTGVKGTCRFEPVEEYTECSICHTLPKQIAKDDKRAYLHVRCLLCRSILCGDCAGGHHCSKEQIGLVIRDLEKEIESMESHNYPDEDIDKVQHELENLVGIYKHYP